MEKGEIILLALHKYHKSLTFVSMMHGFKSFFPFYSKFYTTEPIRTWLAEHKKLGRNRDNNFHDKMSVQSNIQFQKSF